MLILDNNRALHRLSVGLRNWPTSKRRIRYPWGAGRFAPHRRARCAPQRRHREAGCSSALSGPCRCPSVLGGRLVFQYHLSPLHHTLNVAKVTPLLLCNSGLHTARCGDKGFQQPFVLRLFGVRLSGGGASCSASDAAAACWAARLPPPASRGSPPSDCVALGVCSPVV